MAEARPRNSRSYTLPPLHIGVGSRFGSLRTPGATKYLIFITSPLYFPGRTQRLSEVALPDLFDGALPLSYVMTPSLTAPREDQCGKVRNGAGCGGHGTRRTRF
jgi:hypothetical protein